MFHSSVEASESSWSEGGNKQAKAFNEIRQTQEVNISVEHELKDLSYQSRTYGKLQTLMNRVNEESIKEQHSKQARGKARGVDGVTKDEYGKDLDANVADLINRMKTFKYKPLPVRRTYIPKLNGKMRPLGIPSYEDKLVQGAMAGILTEIYEERFLDCSYGFRPGRSAHDAVRYIHKTIMSKKVCCVLETDIKGFFDNVSHDWLMKFLEHDIEDKNFLRYIKRFLIAGVMEGTDFHESDKGTPQGGIISPILANVYLHYVLDLWVEKVLKKRFKGEIYYARYADDFIFVFHYRNNAEQVMAELRSRLSKFGLEVAEDKTRILPMGRFFGTKESFDFLGFTFFNAKSRLNRYMLGVRTSMTKLKAKKQAAKAWLKGRLTKPITETMKFIKQSLKGHLNYYGVSGNTGMINNFYRYVQFACYRMLNRRDQKGKFAMDKFIRMWKFFIEAPRIVVKIWADKPMPV